MKRTTWLVLAGGVLLAACGGAQSASSGNSTAVPNSSVQSTAHSAAAPAPSGATVRSAGPQQPDAASQPAPFPVPPPSTGEGPKVIRTAQLTIGVESGGFDNGLTSVENLIRGQGGYISGSTAQGGSNERLRTGTFSFQVPVASFDETLDRLRKLGQVESFAVSGTDVSLQYVDLEARLRNAEAQAAAIQALLQKATTVQEIIAVQNQLGQITGQVEQLKGQINYFDHATGFATVSVTLREAGATARPQTDAYGTRTALGNAAHNFLAGVNVMIVALGTAGPFLILVLLGLVVIWWVSRRREARQAT